jgi:hypothetical protein
LADNAPLNDLKKNTFLVVTARNTSFEMGRLKDNIIGISFFKSTVVSQIKCQPLLQ